MFYSHSAYVARRLIMHQAYPAQYCHNRIRKKIARWSPRAPAAHVVHIFIDNMRKLSTCCRPAVVSAQFRCVWNGVPTSHRMRQMHSVVAAACKFGCPSCPDKIEHYLCCSVVWTWLSKPHPIGLGLDPSLRSCSDMLMLNKRLDQQLVSKIGIAVYAITRCLHTMKDASGIGTRDVVQMLALQAKEGGRTCKTRLS